MSAGHRVASSSAQVMCVPRQMFTNETGDEVIAVVVAALQAELQRMRHRVTGRLQALRLKLAGEEFIGIALIDQ